MLDTDICIYLIKNKPEGVLENLKAKMGEGIALSAVTLAELEYGVQGSAYPEKNTVALHRFLALASVLPFGDSAAVEYGKLRALLKKSGGLIGPLDMLIAAHALSERLTLVTNNTREFTRVQGLDVENWA